MEQSIHPVILGADLNCYSVARAFHEKYGVVCDVFAKEELGPVFHSCIIRFHPLSLPDENNELCDILISFAEINLKDAYYLFACSDEYADFIIRNKDKLSRYFFCPYPNIETADLIRKKDDFYQLCEEYSLPYPKTVSIARKEDFSLTAVRELGFPIVIKPSLSLLYWKYPFPNMKKAYLAQNEEEAEKILADIFVSGYPETVLLQKYVPGNDCDMYVLTCYSGTDGTVKAVATAHVLLEEHAPKAIGNHAAAITCRLPALTDKILSFLNQIHYCGFSNFDIKYNESTDEYFVFEINLRQGRSNYYMTGSGLNIAELVVSDSRQQFGASLLQSREKHFWHAVPMGVVKRYTADTSLVLEAEEINSHDSSAPLFYKYDIIRSPLRLAYLILHQLKYYKKYKAFCLPDSL